MQRTPYRGFRRYLTFLQWLPRYNRRLFGGDLVGGITIAVVLIPQAMAYSVLAGLSPVHGLYASLVPLVLFSLLTTARHVAIGVTAVDMILLSAGVGLFAEKGTGEYLALVVMLTLMVGLIQVAFGFLRLGFIVNLLSMPVVTGFTTAAILFIAASQVGNLAGATISTEGRSLFDMVATFGPVLRDSQPLALAVGLASAAVLIAVRVWARRVPAARRVPGALIVVTITTLLAWYFGWHAGGLPTVGEVPRGLPALVFPPVRLTSIGDLLPTALTLALIQFVTVISVGRLYAGKHGYPIRANRELVSVGAANLGAGIFQGLPVSGSLSRSAIGDQSGVQTPIANVVAAAVVLVTLLVLTPAFSNLPIPALAAIIIVSSLALIDLGAWRRLVRVKLVDGLLAGITLVATVSIGLHQGLLAGVAASVVAIVYRISKPNVAILGKLPGTRSYRNVKRYPEAERDDDILIIRIDASFSFANADFLRDLLLDGAGPVKESTHAVVVDMSSVNDLDTTAVAVLRFVADTLQERGIRLLLAGTKSAIEDTLRRAGLYDQLGHDSFFLSPHRAVEALRK